MWFLEKVAIMCVAQFIMIPRAHTKPHTFLNNNQPKGNNKYTPKNYLPSVQAATVFKKSDKDGESILKAFNFHDIEYPVAATPRPQQFYFQDFNDNQSPQINVMPDASNIQIGADLKSARNGTFNNLQKFVNPTIKSNVNKPKGFSVLPVEFTSGSDFRNVGHFPEVEYPLNAKEIWKPNYWSIPSNGKDALLAEDAQLNQNFANIYPTRNLRISSNTGKCRSFSIKSCSDIRKNKERLKQILENKANNTNNKQNNSTYRNDFMANCEKTFATNDIQTLPIEETIQELHTTAMPYYFTPIDIIPDCEEFNIDFSNSFPVFNKSNKNDNYSFIPFQNTLISSIMKSDNAFTNNNALNLEEKSKILLKHNNSDRKDIISNNILEEKYDLYDIIDIRKPESDLCGLDEDYATDIYSEEKNIGWFSHPISTPLPFSATTDDLAWKNCKIITPCEFKVDELEDYYISV